MTCHASSSDLILDAAADDGASAGRRRGGSGVAPRGRGGRRPREAVARRMLTATLLAPDRAARQDRRRRPELPRARRRGGGRDRRRPGAVREVPERRSSATAPTSRWRAADTAQVDYEAELAVVIGAAARDVAARARARPRRSATRVSTTCRRATCRSATGSGCGQEPRHVLPDRAVARDRRRDRRTPAACAIRCRVNGEVARTRRQPSMIHGVAELIAFCSRFFTLEPGDVIATGTPGGVGAFRRPPRVPRAMATRSWSTSRASARSATAAGSSPSR